MMFSSRLLALTMMIGIAERGNISRILTHVLKPLSLGIITSRRMTLGRYVSSSLRFWSISSASTPFIALVTLYF